MAKQRIVCPECGHHHTIETIARRTTSTRVRANKLPGNKFEYVITAPQEEIETGEFTTVTDDLVLSGAVGIAFGALCGACASLVAPDYAIQIVSVGASGGAVIAWGWLCAEYNTRLKRIAPWFAEQQADWKNAYAQASGETGTVNLTVDHRYRDGTTEMGRTIKYFGTLPVDLDRFNEYARAALRGDSLGIAHWTGSGALFSRSEYDRLLDLLRRAGTVINVPGKGNMITGGGKRALANHLRQEESL
jgi:hypothetical protein